MDDSKGLQVRERTTRTGLTFNVSFDWNFKFFKLHFSQNKTTCIAIEICDCVMWALQNLCCLPFLVELNHKIQRKIQIQIQNLQIPKYSPIPVELNQVVGKLASRRTISRWIGSRATRFMPESKARCRLV